MNRSVSTPGRDCAGEPTDLETVVTVLAPGDRSAPAVEVTYLWALSATLQDVAVAACLLVIGCACQPRPGPGSDRWVHAVSPAWTVVVDLGDLVTIGSPVSPR